MTDKSARKSPLKTVAHELLTAAMPAIYYFALLAWEEICFHVAVFESIGSEIFIPLLFAIPVSLLLTLLTTIASGKLRTALYYVFTGIIVFVFGLQLVYFDTFYSFFTPSLSGVGADLVRDFSTSILIAIWDNIIKILLLALPFGLIWLVRRRERKIKVKRTGWKGACAILVCMLLLHPAAVGLMGAWGQGSHTPYDLYNNTWVLDLSVEKLGVITSMRKEVQSILFKDGKSGLEITSSSASSVVEFIPEPETQYNVTDIDFDALIEKETDPELAAMHGYFSSLEPTEKNEYTGMFEGYNLITICAESFASFAVVDEELTPTLYRLTHGGFIFNNYYTMNASNTTNGEYEFCQGLVPDITLEKTSGSFLASADNFLPYTLGKLFNEQGCVSRAYHSHSATYYSRNLTHPNMGYIFKARNQGLKLTGWPESDLEMMKQSVGDYIADSRFHAYYMTVSGHHNYKFTGVNDMAEKNKAAVEGLDLSEAARAYIACNLELEYALTYLMDSLEAQGVLDKTVIVLAADHYPYGLRDEEHYELSGKVDSVFGRFESTLILYNSAMEPVEIDKPCCSVDILPTILNLFGFEYDSRLLSGKDILSDSEGLVMFGNQSFITEYVKYDSRTGKARYLTDAVLSETYIDDMIAEVKNRFTYAAAILNKDYYSVVIGRDEVRKPVADSAPIE